MDPEFILALCTAVYFKCIIKMETAIFLSFRKKRRNKIHFGANLKKKLKRPSLHCQKCVNQKYLWCSRTDNND